MTKCSLFFVSFLVAIAVSDALQARAAGTLPRSATSVQDKATESTVSGKRALQSKKDTKGAADEERGLNGLSSRLESLSPTMKSTTDWMARMEEKGASFSVSGVSQKELKEGKAIAVKLENLQSDLQDAKDVIITGRTMDRVSSGATRKVGRRRITWLQLNRELRRVQKKKDRRWQKAILKRDDDAADLAKVKKKVDDINAAIQARSNTPPI